MCIEKISATFTDTWHQDSIQAVHYYQHSYEKPQEQNPPWRLRDNIKFPAEIGRTYVGQVNSRKNTSENIGLQWNVQR